MNDDYLLSLPESLDSADSHNHSNDTADNSNSDSVSSIDKMGITTNDQAITTNVHKENLFCEEAEDKTETKERRIQLGKEIIADYIAKNSENETSISNLSTVDISNTVAILEEISRRRSSAASKRSSVSVNEVDFYKFMNDDWSVEDVEEKEENPNNATRRNSAAASARSSMSDIHSGLIDCPEMRTKLFEHQQWMNGIKQRKMMQKLTMNEELEESLHLNDIGSRSGSIDSEYSMTKEK